MSEQSKASPFYVLTVLMAKNVDELSSFYQKAFGFKSLMISRNLSGRNVTEVFAYGESVIVVREEGQFELTEVSPKTSNTPSPINISLMCDDVDKRYEIAKANGAEVIFPPKMSAWEGRMCKLRDPSGYVWYFEKLKSGIALSDITLPTVQSH